LKSAEVLCDITGHFAFYGCDIRAAFVETNGFKATDSFYLTKDGEKIDSETKSRLEEMLLKL
jgi:UTP:GlnB (protein PII) uridylyltransferase